MTPSQSADPATLASLVALSGTVLASRYALGRVIGAGGMGAVFEARQLSLDRAVAIKILRPVFVGHEEYIRRFLQEARVAARILHSNIVGIHELDRTPDGLVYSVMELLRGRDFDQHLHAQPGQRLPWPYACDLLQQVAKGLGAAHAHGVIHRDVKPANCFLTTNEDDQPLVKIVDFGVAKDIEASDTQQLTTVAGTFGTPAYIAPELLLRVPASPRSDVYSLGVLAYRMLTGKVPFTGETPFQILQRASLDPVPPLREHAPDLPPAVEALVLRMLAKNPEERPQDMRAVREGLLAVREGTLLPPDAEIASARPFGDAEQDGLLGPSGTAPFRLDGGPDPAEVLPLEQPMATELAISPLVVSTVRATPQVPDVEVADAATPLPEAEQSALESSPMPVEQTTGPTPSSIPEATLPLGEADHRQPPRRARNRLTMWLGVSGFAAALVVGTIVVQTIMSAPRDDRPSPTKVTMPAAGPTPVVESGPTPERVPADNAQPRIPPEPIPQPAPPPEPPPNPSSQPQSTSQPESQPARPLELKPNNDRPERVRKKLDSPGPPSDGVLIKKLTRIIRSNCGNLMTAPSVDIFFLVLSEGTISGLNVAPRDAAGLCALEHIRGTIFRKRTGSGPIKFTVKQQ